MLHIAVMTSHPNKKLKYIHWDPALFKVPALFTFIECPDPALFQDPALNRDQTVSSIHFC